MRRLPVLLLGLVLVSFVSAQPSSRQTPQWVWLSRTATQDQVVYFRKDVTFKNNVKAVRVAVAPDDEMTLFVDGKEVFTHSGWESPAIRDVTDAFVRSDAPGGQGKHVLAVRAKNHGSTAALLMRVSVDAGRDSTTIVTDASWRASPDGPKGWTAVEFDDSAWKPATVLGKLGDGPWTSVTEATLTQAAKTVKVTATPADKLKVAKDFKAELLWSVPADTQGSWVNLCVEPKGRLIVSDQYGGLFRVTPPPLGGKADLTKVEPIRIPIGEAQGLLWAFDSLYVVVNRGKKYDSGLYRVRDTNGDDQLDEVKLLRKLEGGGEHGPHAVILSPDGKSLHICCGNGTQLTKYQHTHVPKLWGEDHVLPRMPDGNGFMAGVLGPGGAVYRVTPDGSDWTLISVGFRNEYDIAFNRHGELFSYDADMEWDMNTPWYRPTRVCLVTSGSEFGWLNGAGKWPAYYPDNLPAVVNVGPGSPTGIGFGYGTRFPAKYQDALYICDWSYGKLYATHLTPDGSAYTGELEEFVNGTPLPLTDVIANPTDGALYFTTGGRQTTSGLYRITYVGKESTTPSRGDSTGAEIRALRHKIEAFHGRTDPKAVDAVWPYLGHADRYIRFAARVALEFQGPKTWQDRALAEKDPQAALTALLGLVRASATDPFHRSRTTATPTPEPGLRDRILEALDRISWERLTDEQKVDLLRVYGIAFVRMDRPTGPVRQKIITRLDSAFPSKNSILNAELCQVLIALEAPSAATKTMALMADAPTQEEQINYARALRVLKTGWTPELRKQYFGWFLRANTFKGGSSFAGFMKIIKTDALATLTDAEKVSLRPIIEARPEVGPTYVVKPRPFVKKWTMAELMPVVEKGLVGRDFDRGRSLFGAASCFACHRYDNEGGAQGPDLSIVSGRFSPRDLLESIVEPNKVISDQYAAVTIETTDGRMVTGRIVNLQGNNIMVNTDMLNPNAIANIDTRRIESKTLSKVSMMPEGLLDTLKEDEVLDLMAYLLSRGDRKSPMFRR